MKKNFYSSGEINTSIISICEWIIQINTPNFISSTLFLLFQTIEQYFN